MRESRVDEIEKERNGLQYSAIICVYVQTLVKFIEMQPTVIIDKYISAIWHDF